MPTMAYTGFDLQHASTVKRRVSELLRTAMPGTVAHLFPLDEAGRLMVLPPEGGSDESGAVGTVARSLAETVASDGRVRSVPADEAGAELLALPLARGGDAGIIAVLALAGPGVADAEAAAMPLAAFAAAELAFGVERQGRLRAEAMADAQNRVLRSIASTAPLAETLTVLARQLEGLLTDSRCAIFVASADGTVLTPEAAPSMPEAFVDRFGATAVDDKGSPYAAAVRQGDAVVLRSLAGDACWSDYAARVADLSVGACWAVPVMDESGAVLGVISLHLEQGRAPGRWEQELVRALSRSTAIAIEHARAERALRDSEERFRDLVETSSDYIWEMNEHGVNVYSSPQIEQILGYTPEELMGMRPTDPMSTDERDRLSPVYQSIIESRKPFHCLENVNIAKDGRTVVLETSGVPIFDEDGVFRGYRGIDRDITDRKRLEEQLLISQKLEAVGRLAGGVAHDFNNLLTAINGHVELVAMEIPSDAAIRDDLDEIRRAADRASSLTRQLLAFSRRQVLQPEVLDLNQVVDSLRPMLARLIPEHVSLRVETDRSIGPVLVDPGQMEQVLVNLAVNASDAMPAGGDLWIRTHEAEFAPVDLLGQEFDLKPGRYVVLEVEDTGHGMTEDVRSQVFEPFFTTKPTGKGTGLGLATVYGIVQQSGGGVRVDSEPGQGSVFRIYLPRCDAPVDAPRAAGEATDGLTGTEAVLLVEDERGVRELLRKTLEKHGYHVIEAENGAEGLGVAVDGTKAIDILVTDVVMPRMNGPELASAVRSHRPDLPVLFMSGYVCDEVMQQGPLDPGTDLLEKPFSNREFLSRVRRVLEGRRT